MKSAYFYLFCIITSCVPLQGMRIMQRSMPHMQVRYIHLDAAYQVMNASSNESLKSIKKKYHALAKHYHPDHNQRFREAAEKKFQEINEAYEVIEKEHVSSRASFQENSELERAAAQARDRAYAEWLQEQEMKEQDAEYEQWQREQQNARSNDVALRKIVKRAFYGLAAFTGAGYWLAHKKEEKKENKKEESPKLTPKPTLPPPSFSLQAALKKMNCEQYEKELQIALQAAGSSEQLVCKNAKKEYAQRIQALEKSITSNSTALEIMQAKRQMDATTKAYQSLAAELDAILNKVKSKETYHGNRVEIIRLLKQGANPERLDQGQCNPAIVYNDHAMIELLAQAGLNFWDQHFTLYLARTPLMAYQLIRHGAGIQGHDAGLYLLQTVMGPEHSADLIPFYADLCAKEGIRIVPAKREDRVGRYIREDQTPWYILAAKCREYKDNENALAEKVDKLLSVCPDIEIKDCDSPIAKAKMGIGEARWRCEACANLVFIMEKKLANRHT